MAGKKVSGKKSKAKKTADAVIQSTKAFAQEMGVTPTKGKGKVKLGKVKRVK